MSSVFTVQDRHNSITPHNGRLFITFSPKSFAVVVAHGFERLRHAGDGQQTVERDRAEQFHVQHHRTVIAEDKLSGVDDGHWQLSAVRTPKVRSGLGARLLRARISLLPPPSSPLVRTAVPCNHRPRSELNQLFIYLFFCLLFSVTRLNRFFIVRINYNPSVHNNTALGMT